MNIKGNFDSNSVGQGVAVLFGRRDSVYKSLGCDVWDIDRDARNYSGIWPIIAHPPCRAWGKLRKHAKPRPGEKELAFFAVDQVRKNGGVLEHPDGSQLWKEYALPDIGKSDSFGGFTFFIDQDWFGHRCQKATRLYIVGIRPADLPIFPIKLEDPTHVVCHRTGFTKGKPGWRPRIDTAEREHTPILLAKWLIEIAKRCAS